MEHSAMKQNCKPLSKCRRPATQNCKWVLNSKPEPEIISPNLTFMIKARFRPDSQAKCTQYVKMWAAARHR